MGPRFLSRFVLRISAGSIGQRRPDNRAPCSEHGRKRFSPRFSISLERGGRQQHLHIQGILALPWPKDEIKELVALLKAILGVRRGDKSGCVIEVRRMLLSTNLSRNFILT